MNWIKANKFLSVFFAAMLVGVGVLGYLLFSARSHYQEVRGRYDDQSTELNRLQSLQPYPAPANVQAMDVQKKQHQEAILGLRKTLATNQIPLEPMSEVQFQDKLRESVSRVRAKAAEKGVAIESPEKFYMGFALYETQPPRPEAAPLLGRQLKAIEVVVTELIEQKVASFNLDRPPLPEESEKRSAARANEEGGSGGEGRRGGEAGPAPLVSRQTFDIVFTAEQGSFQKVLNDIVNNKTQFYIPRALEVNNQAPQSPPREAAAAAPQPPEPGPVPPPIQPPVPVPPVPPPAAPAEALKLIFGNEKVQTGIRVEIINFADVPAPAGK